MSSWGLFWKSSSLYDNQKNWEKAEMPWRISLATASKWLSQVIKQNMPGLVQNIPFFFEYFIDETYESWAKGPWKGFPLRKPLGMQLPTSLG